MKLIAKDLVVLENDRVRVWTTRSLNRWRMGCCSVLETLCIHEHVMLKCFVFATQVSNILQQTQTGKTTHHTPF